MSLSLSSAVYAADQLDPAGDAGWLVATLPMTVDSGSSLLFEAHDFAGGVMSETVTVTAQPMPQAVISAPLETDRFGPGEQAVLDGTASVVPTDAMIWFGALIENSGDPERRTGATFTNFTKVGLAGGVAAHS